MRNDLEQGWKMRERIRKGMKNKGRIILACLLALIVSGCGMPSGERIAEVQGMYADLVNLHNEVVEAYAVVEDDTYGEELDAMAERVNNIGQQDTQGMTNEELNAAAEEIDAYKETYLQMMTAIQEMGDGEKKKEIYEVPVTIENNTGVVIHNLYLYKASDKDKGENLVEESGFLDGFQTLNILNLFMAEDETLWRLEATEESGKVIESVDIDFKDKTDGTTIVMKFSFDSMEGWVEFR